MSESKARKTTRIVVEIGGELKRVLTIQEKPDGGLLLLIPCKGTFGFLPGKRMPMEEHRYSIHLSKKSSTGEHTFHCTTRYRGGEETHVHQVTRAVRDHRYQPIIVKVLPVHRTWNYPLVPGPRDEIVKLDSFDPARFQLVYSVWISSPQAADGFPERPKYYSTLKFKQFSFFLPFVFARNPSGPISIERHYTTTTWERITFEEAFVGHRPGTAEGAGAEEAFKVIISEFQRLTSLPRVDSMTHGLMPAANPPVQWSEPLPFGPKPTLEV